MASVLLTDRTLVRVSGPEAEHLLQNIVTADLDTLEPDQAKPCALLTPQGKILFDFLISRDGADAFRLDCRAELAADLMRRLMLYKLRAKAEIAQEKELLVATAWGDDSAPSRSESSASETDSIRLHDLRFANIAVWRIYARQFQPTTTLSDWNALRIANGVAESGVDYDLGDAFPHDVLLDQNGGVGFKKGCYVGQEVVSRMQHRGTARRRVLIASASANLPPARTDITANGRVIGALGTIEGRDGLAIVRIDRVKDALDDATPILADGVSLQVAIPPGALFAFPSGAGDDA